MKVKYSFAGCSYHLAVKFGTEIYKPAIVTIRENGTCMPISNLHLVIKPLTNMIVFSNQVNGVELS